MFRLILMSAPKFYLCCEEKAIASFLVIPAMKVHKIIGLIIYSSHPTLVNNLFSIQVE